MKDRSSGNTGHIEVHHLDGKRGETGRWGKRPMASILSRALIVNKLCSWKSIVRSIAILKHVPCNKKWKVNAITPVDILNFIVQQLKAENLSQELEKLQQKTCVSRGSSIALLNPHLGDEGLIRVGWRLEKAVNMSDLEKRLILISRNTNLTKAIIGHYHEKVHHVWHRSTLAAIREAGFRFIQGTSTIKSVIFHCVDYVKLQKPPVEQKMG